MKNFTDFNKYAYISAFVVAGENFTVAKDMLDRYAKEMDTCSFAPKSSTQSYELMVIVEEMISDYEKAQPVRKIRANRRSLTGWINGFPTHDPVQFESSIERDCAYQLLFDRRVVNVLSQPLTITFAAGDKVNKSYTPDYLVEYKDGGQNKTVLIECKPEKTWLKNKTRLSERYRYVTQWANEREMRFVLLTDKVVKSHSLENIKLLYPQLLVGPMNPERYSEFQPEILRELPATNSDILKKITSKFPSQSAAQTEILAMIAHGQIVCDLYSPLVMETILKKQGGDWEPSFLFDRGIEFYE